MKKLIAIAVAVVVVLTLGSGAIFARPGDSPPEDRAVFEADIVDLPDGDDLDTGEVYVRGNGDVKVEIDGAPLGQTYEVYLLEFFTHPWVVTRLTLLGTMDEIGDGEYKLETTLYLEDWVSSPVFAINNPSYDPEERTQFVSGFWSPATP